MNKTGTKSISEALQQLGITVSDFPQQLNDFLDHWIDVFQNGTKPDVKRVHGNANAVVDIPGNLFWEEILETFPDCKVILSERTEDSWVQSWVKQLEMTHASPSQTAREMNHDDVDCCRTALLGSIKPKSTCVFKKRYRMHNHRVKSTVPAEKLLVFNVKQGWKPLCDFLGCEVPIDAFPHENIKGEIVLKLSEMKTFERQVKWEVLKSFWGILFIIAVIVASLVAVCYL